MKCPALLCMSMFLVGCFGSNHNGQKQNGRDTLTIKPSAPVNSGLYSTSSTAGSDGQWWCIEVSGTLRPIDGREVCVRSQAQCQKAYNAAHEQMGYKATACAPRQQAVCFPYLIKATGNEGERCFITGAECERVFREIMGDTAATGCAIQTNDRPPSGGGTS